MVPGVTTVLGMRYIDQELFTTEVVQKVPVILIGTSKLTMMLKSAGRVVTNTAIQAAGSRGNGVTEAARMALVMKTVVLG